MRAGWNARSTGQLVLFGVDAHYTKKWEREGGREGERERDLGVEALIYLCYVAFQCVKISI